MKISENDGASLIKICYILKDWIKRVMQKKINISLIVEPRDHKYGEYIQRTKENAPECHIEKHFVDRNTVLLFFNSKREGHVCGRFYQIHQVLCLTTLH